VTVLDKRHPIGTAAQPLRASERWNFEGDNSFSIFKLDLYQPDAKSITSSHPVGTIELILCYQGAHDISGPKNFVEHRYVFLDGGGQIDISQAPPGWEHIIQKLAVKDERIAKRMANSILNDLTATRKNYQNVEKPDVPDKPLKRSFVGTQSVKHKTTTFDKKVEPPILINNKEKEDQHVQKDKEKETETETDDQEEEEQEEEQEEEREEKSEQELLPPMPERKKEGGAQLQDLLQKRKGELKGAETKKLQNEEFLPFIKKVTEVLEYVQGEEKLSKSDNDDEWDLPRADGVFVY